jgi:GNAT superfamily N-acetyltransferase
MGIIDYRLSRPPLDAYLALFETTGWNREYQATPEEIGRALENSQFLVAAYAGERLVGFGRVLTDGSLHAMIYDLIVHPDFQGLGIGGEILRRLVAWCQAARIRDIQLFCARGKRGFYERRGFVARPEDGPGMQYRREP